MSVGQENGARVRRSGRWSLVACLLVCAGFVGCATVEPEPTADADALRLYVFDCGRIRLENINLFGLASTDTDVRELAVPCYLIEHPAGRLLWEGGLPSALVTLDGWAEDQGGISQRLERTLVDQLGDLGLAPADVDWIAFSHFHSDHVGAAAAFAGSTLLIQQAEAIAAFGNDALGHFFDPEIYAALADSPREVIDGRHDVFGDGRVMLLPAPGHTPGHQALFVDLASTGPVVLAGDLYHFEASRELRAVPMFNHDRETTLASMNRIEAFTAGRGATLWIQHSLALFESQRHAPAFYD